MKGNEAIARAAILGGLDAFFGYPITPQNEIPEYLSKHLPKMGKVFVQAESETAAINMVYGAAAAGARTMTTSSSPGIALMQEGISYSAGQNFLRARQCHAGGPGLGGIQPRRRIIIKSRARRTATTACSPAPENLQETVDLMKEAFDIADFYRNPVMIAVGAIGQMMETVDLHQEKPKRELRTRTGPRAERKSGLSIPLFGSRRTGRHNFRLFEKYRMMEENEQRYELVKMEEAEFAIVAYGTMARIARSALELLEEAA